MKGVVIFSTKNKKEYAMNNEPKYFLIDEDGNECRAFTDIREAKAFFMDGEDIDDDTECALGIYYTDDGKQLFTVRDYGHGTNCFLSDVENYSNWYEEEWTHKAYRLAGDTETYRVE